MENATDFFNQVVAYATAFVAFISGLFVNFKEADKRMKVVYLIGGMIALAVVLAIVQGIFG